MKNVRQEFDIQIEGPSQISPGTLNDYKSPEDRVFDRITGFSVHLLYQLNFILDRVK